MKSWKEKKANANANASTDLTIRNNDPGTVIDKLIEYYEYGFFTIDTTLSSIGAMNERREQHRLGIAFC